MDSVLLLLNIHAISFPNDGCRTILITRFIAGCKQGGRAVCPSEIGFCLCCSSLFQQRLMTVWCAWSYREWIEAPRMAEAFRGGVEGPCRPSVWHSSEHVRNVFSSLVTKQWVFDSCAHPLGVGVSRGGVQQQKGSLSALSDFIVLRYVIFSSCENQRQLALKCCTWH